MKKRHQLLMRHHRNDQSGINMVDLMMWLVIAALLLAAAIQGIGYYQQAAYLNNLKSDAFSAGTNVTSVAASNDGNFTRTVVDRGVADTKLSAETVVTVQDSASGGKPYIRMSHPGVTDKDVIYLFDSCGDNNVGVNVIPKSGTPALEDCGVTVDGGGGGGDLSTPVNWGGCTPYPLMVAHAEAGLKHLATPEYLAAYQMIAQYGISSSQAATAYDAMMATPEAKAGDAAAAAMIADTPTKNFYMGLFINAYLSVIDAQGRQDPPSFVAARDAYVANPTAATKKAFLDEGLRIQNAPCLTIN